MSDDSAVSPNYYKGFTNGAQPIDITEHLTGNAAQAVQYLTRACRVDGVVKSDPIEDIDKAIWFCQRERSRMVREQETRTILGTRNRDDMGPSPTLTDDQYRNLLKYL